VIARDGSEAAATGVALQTLKIGAHVGSVLIAEVAIFFESFADDEFQAGRNAWIQMRRRSGVQMKNEAADFAGAGAVERNSSGGHFVEDGAEGEEVGTGVNIAGPNLLGGHVRDGAENGARAREMFGVYGTSGKSFGGAGEIAREMDFGESEIEDFGAAAFGDLDVGGLDVSMDDALGVGGVECVGEVNRDVEQALEIERAC
jgi:hypothetical protein